MPKVLVIGWDAADWKVINALVDQGKMPHTAKLIERGVMGDLATLHPVLSPMLWTSIATGKRPYKHGIYGFTEPTPDGGGIQPVSQLSRKTKAIWNILNQSGYRSHVIGWWPSHPVEPINGVMVSNHFHTAIGPPEEPWPLAPGMVHPERLAETLAALRINPNELVAEQVLPFVPRAGEIDQDKDRRLGMVMKTLAECATVHAAATWTMEHEPWDFMGVYYDAIDHFCHGFMKYHPPRRAHIPERDFELYSGVVEAAYRFHDMMLGAMLALAPEDTTVIVCSDHGFHPDHLRPVQLPKEPAGPAIEHRDLGMILMAGPGIRRDRLIHGANLLDITPTLLTLFGLPVGEDMDGKPLLDAFTTPPPVSHIPSWDAVAGDDARIAGEYRYDPLAAKEAMDQLVALGYVEAPVEGLEKAIANTVREMRYNLARAWMDGGFHAQGGEILAELYAAAPDQYRFGVHLALCHQALGQVAALRELVESMTAHRQAAAAKAGEDLKGFIERIKARQAEAGQLTAEGEIDFEQTSDEEKQAYDDLRMTARFSTHDLDFLMSWVWLAEGKPEAALERLTRAGQSETRRPSLHIQIGETLVALRRWPEAEAAFRRALILDPRNPHAHLGMAKACLRQGRVEEGVAAALDSVGFLYQNPMAHYILGLGLLRMKQYFRAVEAVRVAVSINPNFERAHRFLARYALRGELSAEKAREHWRIVREIRERGRAEGRARASQPALAAFSDNYADDYADDAAQERRAPGLDAAPRPLVDKSAVPDDPAQCVIVVAGLPRSGTSMMMQMLAAGPLPILSDGKREADSDNPRGYHELESATRLRQERDWIKEARGKAVKIVAQLLPHLPPELPYRVVFMEREPKEMLASQKTMLERLGREAAKLSDAQLEQAYRQQLKQVGIWLAKQPNIKTLFVSHRESIDDPHAVAARVNEFLGGKLDPRAMAAAVDGSLYRQRA
ncbi:MAG: alkaline phosphatase family protein [Pseudomonadota bacterium]|nr:alkaline phosphatase family protein [Pseudomonadota bacterium]